MVHIESLYIFGSVILVSLVSFIGIISILFAKKEIPTILLFLVSFSAGALLGDAFIHLLPEAVREYGFGLNASLFILLGIIIFFALEKFIHWRHCHATGTCEMHDDDRDPDSLAIMNLVGDGLHNLIDGIIIAASYLLSIPVGIATTVAVILHEVPQEIGDFGVMLHAGWDKKKALFFNFLSALLAIVGALISILLVKHAEYIIQYLILLSAGGFIYIAGTDLIPELHKANQTKVSLLQMLGILLGVGVMVLLLRVG